MRRTSHAGILRRQEDLFRRQLLVSPEAVNETVRSGRSFATAKRATTYLDTTYLLLLAVRQKETTAPRQAYSLDYG